jgi:hypothetical protein
MIECFSFIIFLFYFRKNDGREDKTDVSKQPKKPRERKTLTTYEPTVVKFEWLAEFKSLLGYISTHANGMKIHPRYNQIKVPLVFDPIEKRINENYYTDMAKLDQDCREVFQKSLANVEIGAKRSEVK